MDIIGKDRVVLELNTIDRRMFLIVYVGKGDANAIANAERFDLAYTDSGFHKVNSGIAIIERDESLYKDLQPVSKKATEIIQQKGSGFVQKLKENHFVIE